jgi:hypothetical protein
MSDDNDPFIGLEIPDDQIAAHLAVTPRKIAKRREQFTMFPETWVERLADARHIATYRVALELLHLHWRRKGEPVELPNGWLSNHRGVSKDQKARALGELERRRLITVERRGRRTPLVQLHETGA